MKKVAALRAKLTKSAIDKIAVPASGKIIVWDADQAGFGVVVTAQGVKSWIINYRTRDGRQRRLVLGRCDRLTADQARTAARAKLAEVDLGGDPVTERKETRARLRVSALLNQYISDEMPRRKRASTVKLHTGQIERYIRPHLGGMAVADVSREDVRTLHRRISDNGGPITANRMVSLLSAILSFAIELGCITENPAFRFPRHSEQPRRRYLSLEEIARVMADIEVSKDEADRLFSFFSMRAAEKRAASRDKWMERRQRLGQEIGRGQKRCRTLEYLCELRPVILELMEMRLTDEEAMSRLNYMGLLTPSKRLWKPTNYRKGRQTVSSADFVIQARAEIERLASQVGRKRAMLIRQTAKPI